MVKDKGAERLSGWFRRLVVGAIYVALLMVTPQLLAQSDSQTKSKKKSPLFGIPAPDGGVYGRSSKRSVISQGKVFTPQVDSLTQSRDSLSGADSIAQRNLSLLDNSAQATTEVDEKIKEKYFSDSMSLTKVTWTSALLPGFGQYYNKQYWKMPILYGTVAGGIMLYAHETKKYRPLKREFDELTLTNPLRNDHLNDLQAKMIKSNTRRQLYLAGTVASYIYFLGDAAVNYSSNETSDVKRATTLATICPGAGQIYNKSYWKVPFVVGGFAMMGYVLDWNNRGYQRFKKAYTLRADFDANPDNYPDGAGDEFGGRYSAEYLKSLRDSYRRNRDMSFIFIAGLYVLQIVDAHVDAHFKDFDISDDLSMNIEPTLGYSYSPTIQRDCATYGFNVGINF